VQLRQKDKRALTIGGCDEGASMTQTSSTGGYLMAVNHVRKDFFAENCTKWTKKTKLPVQKNAERGKIGVLGFPVESVGRAFTTAR